MAGLTITTTATTTWLCPSGVIGVIAECWGAGGSGGKSANSASGGGGGAYSRDNLVSVFPGTTYSIQIGAGGAAVSVNGVGNAGTDTWFNTLTTVLAKGGSGGNQSGTTAASASGGLAGSCIGDVTFSGGNSGTGSTGFGSGGGGSAGSTGAGGNSANVSGANTAGGSAGTGGGVAGSAGSDAGATTAGGQPGAASGGAAFGGGNAGKGGDGQIILTYIYRSSGIASPKTLSQTSIRPHAFSPGNAR